MPYARATWLVTTAALCLAFLTMPAQSRDTAGVMLGAIFHRDKLVSAEWTAVVEEYEVSGPLRIEFNGIAFRS